MRLHGAPNPGAPVRPRPPTFRSGPRRQKYQTEQQELQGPPTDHATLRGACSVTLTALELSAASRVEQKQQMSRA